MIKNLRLLHRVYVVFVIVFLFLIFYPFYYITSRKTEWYGILNKLRKANSLLCSFLTGIFFRINLDEPLEKGETYIYCANHTSNLDVMILCILAKGRFHFMGKEELLRHPMFKIFFSTVDIPVKRESRMSAFRAFKRAGDNLERGMSLVIFPEGGIGEEHYPPALMPFKNGAFRLAIEKGVRIVPVTMNVWKKMFDDGAKYGSRPGICDIYVHKAVSTKDLKLGEEDLLKDQVFEIINSKLAV